ncbi:metaxin-2 [Teleopsis dalmanni]|uniref:metaxin-2 n=1 Tax=Teleopsis dalmanni TaxID=139649 RepID=UPI0018CD87E1|nr:metaxin-2 [Teleopsis dalmanni]XP_037938458.1 metaxin-2 [Teleopsis dalmanni]XP_037938459.1 metaxin-2 [Teleopsis dalmanni]
MAPTTYLNQLNTAEKMSEPWPNNAILYQPYEAEQILLHEHASCLAVKAYLKMCNLPFEICSRANAEFMSPGGRMTKLPVLRAGQFILAEFEPIVNFVEHKNAGVGQRLNDDDKIDMRTYVSLAENIFTMAELYISFVNDKVYNEVTAPRNGCVYPWPLSVIQNISKRKQALRLLKVYQWSGLTIEEVIDKVEKCCENLTIKLEEFEGDYFYPDGPCDLDAIVFGHLYTMLTIQLPNMALAHTVQKFKNLVKFCQLIDLKYFQTKSA